MDRWFDLGAAVFAIAGAILWFVSAAGGLPTIITYWGAAPANDPFYVALMASARWNMYAAVSTGASALCMGVAAAIRWTPAIGTKLQSAASGLNTLACADVTMTTDEDADRVGQILGRLNDRAQAAIWVLAYLTDADRVIPQMGLDDDEDRIARIAAWYAFQAFEMNIARALDKASVDRDSLYSLFGLLEKPDVRAAMSEDGKEAHIQNAFDLWNQLKTDPKIRKLRALRDSMLAHNLSSRHAVILHDLSLAVELAEKVFTIIDELCLGCYPDSSIGECRVRAASAAGRFWQRFAT
jgi:hypothetical protein